MRYMIAHRTNAHWESGATPTMEMVRAVGGMIGEMVRAGILVAGEGLRASSQGARVSFVAGQATIVKGPFLGANELMSSFAIVSVTGLEEAIDWAHRLAAIAGDMDVDVRPVTEPWDIGAAPPPAALSRRRYMVLQKADSASEAGISFDTRRLAEVGRYFEASARSGVLLASERLAPSSQATRFIFSGGKHVMTDGPFVETRELLGGFVIIKVSTMQEAIDWTLRYATVLGDVELDVHPLTDR